MRAPLLSIIAMLACISLTGQIAPPSDPKPLLGIKRIYVAEFSGGATANQLRELIIASLAATKLFILTEKEDRADAILKGAADDNTFTDTFDYQDSESVHENAGVKTGSGIYGGGSTGIYAGVGGSQSESHHSKERKHEAYAAVRLCDKNGDVVWSTTQESLGAKFKGASADVAAKVARQIAMDYARGQRAMETSAPRPVTAPISSVPKQ